MARSIVVSLSECVYMACLVRYVSSQGAITPMPRLQSVYTTTVGAKRSCARYYLNSVSDVHKVLAQLAGAEVEESDESEDG
jgi:hypothetical protein